MRTAAIHVSLRGKTFDSKFPIKQETPEYKVADEAYRLGMLFAHTQMLAVYGKPVPDYKFGEFIQDLDYTYEIQEENN